MRRTKLVPVLWSGGDPVRVPGAKPRDNDNNCPLLYMTTQTESDIIETKTFRKDLDGILQKLKASSRKSRERSLTDTKLTEAIMWLGMDLKALDAPNPYPNSKDPSNTKIEPTADGLKM